MGSGMVNSIMGWGRTESGSPSGLFMLWAVKLTGSDSGVRRVSASPSENLFLWVRRARPVSLQLSTNAATSHSVR